MSMEKPNKPLKEWTMGEMAEYCQSKDGGPCDGCPATDGECCYVNGTPSTWDFNGGTERREIGLTRDEINLARAVGARYVSIDEVETEDVADAKLWIEKPFFDRKTGVYKAMFSRPFGVLKATFFPSMGLGDLRKIPKGEGEDETQQEGKKNNPLTIDELRQMVGHPAWVQSPGIREYGRWGIVEGVSEDGTALFLKGDFTCHEYGHVWLAYRYPPKEVTDE